MTRVKGSAAAVPPQFEAALESLRDARLRREVSLTEVPAPQRIAPFAAALMADVSSGPGRDDDLASGRFILLHDPTAPEPWQGTFRAVTFVRAELEPEIGHDALLGQVGWSWLLDALGEHGAQYTAEGGTVTRVISESFAGLDTREPSAEIEVRASWTLTSADAAPHLAAWADLLCTVAGLPPLPDGVSALPGARR